MAQIADILDFPIDEPLYSPGSYNDRSFYYDENHLGEDIDFSEGTPVKAIGNGILVWYSPAEGYGELVAVIEHDLGKEYSFPNAYKQIVRTNKILSIYGHIRKKENRNDLKECKWKVGDYVEKGKIIGYINDDEHNGDGEEHLHLGIRLSNKTIANERDPGLWFRGYEKGTNFGKDFASGEKVILIHKLIGVYSDAWHDANHPQPSQPFIDCYNEHGREATFGVPWDNGAGGKWVHSWPDDKTNPDVLWVQDFLTEEGKWTMFVYNPALNKVYPIEGEILEFWHKEWGYKKYGPPICSRELTKDINKGCEFISQTFEKNEVQTTIIYDSQEDRCYAIPCLQYIKEDSKVNAALLDGSNNSSGASYATQGTDTGLTPNIYIWNNNTLAIVIDGVSHMMTNTADFLQTFTANIADFELFHYEKSSGNWVNRTNTSGNNISWQEMREKGWLHPRSTYENFPPQPDLGQYLILSPEFFQEYKGSIIMAVFLPDLPTYLVSETGFIDLGPYKGGGVLHFSLSSGLQPVGKIDYQTEEAFRFIKPKYTDNNSSENTESLTIKMKCESIKPNTGTIKATFSESILIPPQIAISYGDEKYDLPFINMTATEDSKIWIYNAIIPPGIRGPCQFNSITIKGIDAADNEFSIIEKPPPSPFIDPYNDIKIE